MRPEAGLAGIATFVIVLLLGAHWMIAFGVCAVVFFVVDSQMDTHTREQLRRMDRERRLEKVENEASPNVATGSNEKGDP